MNPMRKIEIEKVTLNMGCGEDKDKLSRAEKLLEKISDQKIVITRTHKRTTFGMAKKRPIGVKVTLRGKKAEKLLLDVFTSLDNKIKKNQINDGNFSIGVKEYINLPDVKYDPDIGVIGLDVSVTLERPGYRVKRRGMKCSRIGKKHRITKQETEEWIKKMGVEIIE